jgi:predicted  nucleic acid-binding Zn-ribbon protein
MKRSTALLLIPLTAAVALGCVSKDTYQAAVEESETLKTELDRAQTQTKALDQQLKSLQDQTGKLNAEADLAKAEVQRLTDSGNKELEGFQTRSHDLEQKIKELTAQQRVVRHEAETMKQRNKALEASVAHFQKELKEPPKPVQPPPGPKPGMGPGGMSAGQESLAMKPQDAQSGPQAPPQPPPPEQAPPEDMSLLAALKRWLMSIWHWFF